MSIFDSVQGLRPRKNAFNLSHSFLNTCDIGQVVPVFSMQDLIPGSKVQVDTGQLTRFQALLAPIMHDVNAYISFWAIPYRLIDPNFPDFIAGEYERNGEVYDGAYFTLNGLVDCFSQGQFEAIFGDGSLWDMLGYPAITHEMYEDQVWQSTIKMTPRPLAGYLMILYYKYINENFKSGNIGDLFNSDKLNPGLYQDLMDAIEQGGDVSREVANVLLKLYSINPSCCFPHGWNKDYFTSALPFTQLGDPVILPLAGSAPVSVSSLDNKIHIENPTLSNLDEELQGGAQFVTETVGLQNLTRLTDENGVAVERISASLHNGDLSADLSEASAIDIIQLRIANALQSFKEFMARTGTRYYEYLQGTWGIVSQDQRLQMPQWIQSGVLPINIIPVEQTSATSNAAVEGDKTPAGNLTARANGVGMGFCNFSFEVKEESMILGLLYIQPKTMYGNRGINRHLTKINDRFDFIHPKFEHIGEQEIKNYELFVSGLDSLDNQAFGYTARYAEYKHWDDELHGQFANVLSFWHFGRIFNTTPTLGNNFIYIKPDDVKRPFAVQSVKDADGNDVPLNNTQTMMHFKVKYIAPMSYYGTPNLLN